MAPAPKPLFVPAFKGQPRPPAMLLPEGACKITSCLAPVSYFLPPSCRGPSSHTTDIFINHGSPHRHSFSSTPSSCQPTIHQRPNHHPRKMPGLAQDTPVDALFPLSSLVRPRRLFFSSCSRLPSPIHAVNPPQHPSSLFIARMTTLPTAEKRRHRLQSPRVPAATMFFGLSACPTEAFTAQYPRVSFLALIPAVPTAVQGNTDACQPFGLANHQSRITRTKYQGREHQVRCTKRFHDTAHEHNHISRSTNYRHRQLPLLAVSSRRPAHRRHCTCRANSIRTLALGCTSLSARDWALPASICPSQTPRHPDLLIRKGKKRHEGTPSTAIACPPCPSLLR